MPIKPTEKIWHNGKLIPWSQASVLCKRPLGIVSLERVITGLVVVFVVLLLTRWLVVLGLHDY